MDLIISWDTSLLLRINGAHTPLLDELMWNSSNPYTWVPLYLFLLVMLGWCYKEFTLRENYLPLLLVVVMIAIGVGLSDYVTSGILKKWICRLRPTHTPALEGMLHLVKGYTGGRYGFPSSHAANTCSLFVLSTCLLFGRYQMATRNASMGVKKLFRLMRGITMAGMVLYVVLNCYSRMYLGVHYPTDILCGALIGALIGGLTYLAARPLFPKLVERQNREKKPQTEQH